MSSLRITEIFYSLQGETNTVGLPTVFVRLTGCPLRCQYCDSAYAFTGGEKLLIEDIVNKIKKYKTNYITITGGEPLAQPNVYVLLSQLIQLNYKISIETSGALSVKNLHKNIIKILDIKTPGSKECEKNLLDNLNYLNPSDQIKFVICDKKDYDWSKDFIIKNKLINNYEILFSPSYNQLNYADLADWILSDNLPVRFQLQLHKHIWGDIPGK